MPYKKTIVRREKIQEFYGDNVPLSNEYVKLGNLDGITPTNTLPEQLAVAKQDYKLGRQTKLDIVRLLERVNGNYGVGYYLTLPKTSIEEIECKSILELATPILDSMMLGHWCCIDNYICLHYPQINITNSVGDQYTVYNIVVGIPITKSSIDQNIYGWKYTYTQEELQDRLNFVHPHLQVEKSRDLRSFCLGNSSPLYKWLQSNYNNIDEEKFTLFLYQLKDYLEWESLEGKPYYSIGNFNSLQEFNLNHTNLEVKAFTKILLKYITPDLIINNTFNPGLLGDKFTTLEQTLINSGELTETMVGNYHEATNRFVKVNERAATANLQIPTAQTNLIIQVKEKLNIQERVLPNPERQMSTTVKRIYKTLFEQGVKNINHLLKMSSSI